MTAGQGCVIWLASWSWQAFCPGPVCLLLVRQGGDRVGNCPGPVCLSLVRQGGDRVGNWEHKSLDTCFNYLCDPVTFGKEVRGGSSAVQKGACLDDHEVTFLWTTCSESTPLDEDWCGMALCFLQMSFAKPMSPSDDLILHSALSLTLLFPLQLSSYFPTGTFIC